MCTKSSDGMPSHLCSLYSVTIPLATLEKVGEAILEGLEDVGLAINDAILGSIGISTKTSWQIL